VPTLTFPSLSTLALEALGRLRGSPGGWMTVLALVFLLSWWGTQSVLLWITRLRRAGR